MPKDYQLKYKDVYLFGVVTQYFLGKELIESVESPYKEDDVQIEIMLRNNSVRGYGRRTWQRNKLEAERGTVILLRKGNFSALIGIKETPQHKIKIFNTDTLSEVQQEIARDLIKHLEFNNINVKMSTNEKERNKFEKRFHEGDRIQREAGRDGGRYDTNDYDTDEPEY